MGCFIVVQLENRFQKRIALELSKSFSRHSGLNSRKRPNSLQYPGSNRDSCFPHPFQTQFLFKPPPNVAIAMAYFPNVARYELLPPCHGLSANVFGAKNLGSDSCRRDLGSGAMTGIPPVSRKVKRHISPSAHSWPFGTKICF